MTDNRDEELNTAIDAVFAGEPPSGGDPETPSLARLASHLRGMPSPEFRSRLAAELLPQRPSFLGRIPLLNRITNPSARRIAAPFAAVSALVVAAIAAVLLANPFGGAGGSRTAEAFGELPVPQDTVSAPIEDGSGTITWQIDTNAVLPDSAPAYKLAMPEVTAERAEALAQALGVSGSAEPVDDGSGGVAGYHTGAALDCKPASPEESCGASFDIWTSGWFSYRSGRYPVGPAPDESSARVAARQWIESSGLTNGDAFDLTVEPPPIFPEKPDSAGSQQTIGFSQVTAQPAGHSGPTNGPLIQVTIGGDGTVTDAGGFWAEIIAESDYKLEDSDSLAASLDAQQGTFAMLHAEYGGISGADVSRDAVASVAGIQLSYQPAAANETGNVFLVPVYTVKVDLQQDGKSVAGFATWVPATSATEN